jgi:sugar O-acyltransferase (sialic acid O-acetyltransferase NeuD family)
MRKLVVVGTGLFAEIACVYLRASGRYDVVAFVADKAYAEKTPSLLGLPVKDFAALESQHPSSEHDVFVAIGYRGLNALRARFFGEIKAKGYRFASYVHPSVVSWPESRIGENVFVFEDNTIQPFVTIGDDTILWSGNHIGHHSTIGAHCFITSHAVISGSCVLGDYSFVGVNATIRDGIRIGARNIIGPGSLILKDTQEAQVFLPKGTDPRDATSDRVKL